VKYTGCPSRYRTPHFFNNFTTNEDIARKFVGDLNHCVKNVKEKNVLLFKFRCNIFIGVRIIKEMPSSVASGTPCISCYFLYNPKTSSSTFHEDPAIRTLHKFTVSLSLSLSHCQQHRRVSAVKIT
jgi:hypothetical protein